MPPYLNRASKDGEIEDAYIKNATSLVNAVKKPDLSVNNQVVMSMLNFNKFPERLKSYWFGIGGRWVLFGRADRRDSR